MFNFVLQDDLEIVFEIARFYADSLEHFRKFYNENDNLDLVALQQEEQGL